MRQDNNPLNNFLKTLTLRGKEFSYYDVAALGEKYNRLPYSIRILLESALRNCDNFSIKEQDVQKILNWESNHTVEGGIEVPFKPARVILQDFTGVPALVDFAAMRDAVKNLGGDPEKINPICPVDLWGAKAFDNMLIVPPGSGIVHQVNLEYLARVVFTGKNTPVLYPDTLPPFGK
ncbi:hypothetical protein HUJ05_005243 [Dendroctonus ponderosae]|nr:hypothetical protein HUJ05_005243 [Dendroctonus ponderosae]